MSSLRALGDGSTESETAVRERRQLRALAPTMQTADFLDKQFLPPKFASARPRRARIDEGR